MAMMGPSGRNFIASKRNKSNKETFVRMVKDFKKEHVLLIFVILFSIGSAVLTIMAPIYFGNFLDNVSGSSANGGLATNPLFNIEGMTLKIKWDYFFTQFGTLLGFYIGSAFLSFLADFLAVGISVRYSYTFRDKIINKLNKLPLSYYDRVPYGDTLSVATNDVDNISRNLQSIITQSINGVALFLGSLIAMFVYDYRLAFIALIILPITLIVIFLISRFSQKQFKAYRSELGTLNGKVEEDYAGLTIIKLFNKEKDVEAEFNSVNEKMARADGLSQFLSGFIFPSTIFINNVAYVAIAVVGGIIGQVGKMISFFTLLQLYTRPFQQIGQIVNIIQSVLASGDRVYTLLDEAEEIPDKADAISSEDSIQGEFDFNHVYFQYTKDKPLIEDFTLHVNKGDSIAIVGPTGAGKTTMVNLIMRFYEITNISSYADLKAKAISTINEINSLYKKDNIIDYKVDESVDIKDATTKVREELASYIKKLKETSNVSLSEEEKKKVDFIESTLKNVFNNGNIKLDQKTIFNYTRGALRGSVGMVLQDTWLFKGTIKENLLYGDPNATDEDIEKACKEAHIDHFIHTLPGGYSFMLNEDGDNVSQGQRQLLTIARAIISKPKIMILDEATSSVDTRTEQQIQDALDTIMQGRTSFVIAHRLSTIKNAKLIIVMKKGHIVETGNHKELLAKNGFYAELYNSQFAGNNPMTKENEDS